MTNYPQDEFDQVPESSERQGVHRSKMAAPKARGLGLIILASGLALVIGVLSFFVLPLLGAGGAAESVAASEPTAAATTSAAAKTDSAAPSETAEESSEAPVKETAAEPEGAKSAEPEETGDAAAADQAAPVLVLNGTGTAGLGADVSSTVTANGWHVAGVDNWTGSNLASSVIFYNPGQEAKAQELSALLNIGDVRQTGQGEISDGLTVVIGPGFE